MESNIINQFLSTIRQLSIYDISQLARNLITELMERSEHHLYSESIKKEAYSELMLIKSILFHFDIKVTKQNINAANYTPNRGNQLSIGILVQKLPDFDIKECEIYKKFIKEFWIRCYCTKHCPTKVPFDNALK